MSIPKLYSVPWLFPAAYDFKMFVDSFPELYISLLKFKRRGHWSRHWIAADSTDLVVEGFPRSGNSFAQAAFKQAQDQNVVVASRLHASAHVVYACRRNIPTLVLIRHPAEAIESLCATALEDVERQGFFWVSRVPIHVLIKLYITFYQRVYPLRDQYVLGYFEEVTSNFAGLIERINQKYGTAFTTFQQTSDTVNEIFASNEGHYGPSATRNQFKEDIRKRLKQPRNATQLARAVEWYERFREIRPIVKSEKPGLVPGTEC